MYRDLNYVIEFPEQAFSYKTAKTKKNWTLFKHKYKLFKLESEDDSVLMKDVDQKEGELACRKIKKCSNRCSPQRVSRDRKITEFMKMDDEEDHFCPSGSELIQKKEKKRNKDVAKKLDGLEEKQNPKPCKRQRLLDTDA